MFKGKELEGIVVASRRLRLVEGEAIVPCSSPRCAPNRVSSSAENGHPSVKKAREHIEAHFAEDLSISGLAALVSLSPCYFARTFKKELGLPPHAYLDGVRIRKALEFLENGQSLASAALSAGYVDQSHLTHRFKRSLGITPGQYVMRRRNRLISLAPLDKVLTQLERRAYDRRSPTTAVFNCRRSSSCYT